MEARVPIEIKTKDGLRIEFDLVLDRSVARKLYDQIIKDLSRLHDVPEKFKEPKYVLSRLRYRDRVNSLLRAMESLAVYLFFKKPKAFKVKGVTDFHISGRRVRKPVDPEEIQSQITDMVKTKNTTELIKYFKTLGMVNDDPNYLNRLYQGNLGSLSSDLLP